MSRINGSDDSVDVAIGVFDGKVIAQWKDATTEIVFDPKNAYMIGIALSKAAMEAHRGNSSDSKDLEFLAGELATQKVKITDARRDLLIGKVATILKTFAEQGRTPGYCAMHAVDTVLADTAQ